MSSHNDHDEIEFASPPQAWSHDGEGYPPEAGLDEVDPGRLPESEGMEEDPVPASPSFPVAVGPVDEGEAKTGWQIPGMENMGSHLDELRRRLLVCLSVFLPFFGVGLYFYRELWELALYPLSRVRADPVVIQALSPSDGLIIAMRLSFALAVFLSLPVWVSQVWGFVSPALTTREKRFLYLSLGSGSVLFFAGAAVAFFVGIPFGLDYLMPFNQSMSGWENAFTGDGYVGFLITCCAGFGIAFELPLVMLALALAGILTPGMLREWWRVAVLVIFLVAAFLTPPDPFTQILLAAPMLVLFFLGWWLVKWAQPRR